MSFMASGSPYRPIVLFTIMAALLAFVGVTQSWGGALGLLNLCIISAVMAIGVNIQWGYAGLFNAGVMAFTALGGLAAVLVSQRPVEEAIRAGGLSMVIALGLAAAIAVAIYFAVKGLKGGIRTLAVLLLIVAFYIFVGRYFLAGSSAIEAVNPASTGFLGGFGLPILVSWLVGGLFAAAVAFVIGRIALGLRSDYLAIATLGISEIVIAVLKNEDWLARGVKNVTGLDRPVPYEVNLQQEAWFVDAVQNLTGATGEVLTREVIDKSSLFVKLSYTCLFASVLVIVLLLSVRALNSPWGRMMRAIRDNEDAARAMGKDVTARHRQIFILGSAVVGIAGAMLTTLDGQFTPASYQPLRFTFLIWVMVIVGGSGNNLGAVLGGMLIWFVWIQAEPAALFAISVATSFLAEDNALRAHLLESAPHLRLPMMGMVLLLVMRFSPRGLLPERPLKPMS